MNESQFPSKDKCVTGEVKDGIGRCCCSCPLRDNKRVALVTGSSSGIGANIALDLAANGYFVIVTGRNESNLQRVVSDCNRMAAPVCANHASCQSSEHDPNACKRSCSAATFFKADLANAEQLDKLIEFVLLNFKRLDVLVNNACWRGNYKQLLECDRAYEDFKQVMHLNVSVPLYLVQRCLIASRGDAVASPAAAVTAATRMKCEPSHPNNKAVVINVSSIASQVVVPLHAYSISKACLSELSRQLAQLVTSHDDLSILSVTISPGPVLTDERPHHKAMSDLTLMNRVGTTQEISDLVLFAISNARMFNGKELNIDGGYVTKQKLPLVQTRKSSLEEGTTKR